MKSPTKRPAATGASLIILSSFFYGSYGIWTKLMGDSFGAYSQVALRSILITIVLLFAAHFRHRLEPIKWRRDKGLFLLLIIANALIAAPLYYATLTVGIGLSSTLSYAGFIFGMFILGKLFNNERFTKHTFLATLLAITGLVLLFNPFGGHYSFLALCAGLLSGLAGALDLAIAQRLAYNAEQTVVLTWAAGIVACVPIALLAKDRVPGADIEWVYWLLFASVALAGSWLAIKGVKLVSAGTAGLLGLLEIVFGVLFGVIFFKERPGIIASLGILSIVLAAAIPYLQEIRRAKTSTKQLVSKI